MAAHAGNLILLGGELCLDWTNTIEGRDSPEPHEFFTGYADLVAWSRHAAGLPSEEAQGLTRLAAQYPHLTHATFERAIVLRETLYRIFAAVAAGDTPAGPDLAALNGALAEALARLRVVATPEGFEWEWAENGAPLERVLWPVVRSAGELLTSDRLDRLKTCDGCGWLFIDQSRNRSRRWCDMRFCGNRAKARRHYARQKESAG
jgi:predicted RNA-binding Zn ribbon-like protein